MEKRTLLMAFATILSLSVPAIPAAARDYTPDLSAFYNVCSGTGTCSPAVDTAGFRDFVSQIGEAMSPSFMGPANTLGFNGLELTYSAGFSPVDHTAGYWNGHGGDQPGVARNPGDVYYTNQLRIRKGLPYSIQLGGSVTHLFESSLWGIGLDLSWSFLEGYKKAPDLGIAISVGTLLGAEDLLMIQVNAAFIISKSFNVAGLFTFEPYAGYNMMFATAGTHLTSMWSSDGYGSQFALNPEFILRHRMEMGINAVVEKFVIGGTMTVDFVSARMTGSVRVGVRFW